MKSGKKGIEKKRKKKKKNTYTLSINFQAFISTPFHMNMERKKTKIEGGVWHTYEKKSEKDRKC